MGKRNIIFPFLFLELTFLQSKQTVKNSADAIKNLQDDKIHAEVGSECVIHKPRVSEKSTSEIIKGCSTQ